MRLIKIKRRSTAHYRRRFPPDADCWPGQNQLKPVGSGFSSVARQFNRRAQLEADDAEWMRRTLQRVAIDQDDEADIAGESGDSSRPDKKQSAAISGHQLRQMERDRLIRERRDRGRSLLSWGQQQQQQQQPAAKEVSSSTSRADEADSDSILRVKGLLGSRTGGSGTNQLRRRPHKAAPLRPPPPPLTLSPTPYIQQQALPNNAQPLLQPPLQQQQQHLSHLRRPRRLGGRQQQQQQQHKQLNLGSSERPQYLNIFAQQSTTAASKSEQSTTEMTQYLRLRRQQQQQQAIDKQRLFLASLDKDQTQVQPRNPVNSPELMA